MLVVVVVVVAMLCPALGGRRGRCDEVLSIINKNSYENATISQQPFLIDMPENEKWDLEVEWSVYGGRGFDP